LLSEANGNDIKTTEQRVAWLLEKVPATRNSYLVLLLAYWSVFDGIDLPQECIDQIFANATPPESISRARRKIFELRRQLADIEKEIEALWEEKKSE
jgi:hypothetical protein